MTTGHFARLSLAAAVLAPAAVDGQEERLPDARERPGQVVDFRISPGLRTPPYLCLDEPSQNERKCGPCALYTLLRLWGVSVTPEEVEAAVPLNETGASLEDLRRATDRFGVSAEVRYVTPDEFQHVPLPALVHVSAHSGDQPDHVGHYLVVIRRNQNGGYMIIDSSTSLATTMQRQTFARNATGYALIVTSVPVGLSWLTSTRFLWSGVALLSAANVAAFWWRTRIVRVAA